VKLVLDVRESTYAAFIAARSRYTDERGDRLSDDEVVLAMCREQPDADDVETVADACDVDAGPQTATTQVVAARTRSYQLSISTCRSCAKSYLLAAGREVEVPRSLLEAARCDSRFIGDLEADIPPRALSSVTPRMREQVLARDRNECSVPGCRAKRFLDVHHVKPASLGGKHASWNLTTLCFGHHQLLHDDKLTVSGRAPHALSWSWPEDPTRNSTRHRARFENEVTTREAPDAVRAHVGRELGDETADVELQRPSMPTK
jgi:hypothetical protein